MRHLMLILAGLLVNSISISQNAGIGIGTLSPHPSAALEVKDSARGFLPPRMSVGQRDQILNPADGLQIFNTTTDCLEIYGKGRWNAIYCIPEGNAVATDIDGNNYYTVLIGSQTWTTKNLLVAKYRNGDIIPEVSDPAAWESLTTGAWCWYQNDSSTYGTAYGRLYNWYAVMDPRGLAPAGWHVPSDAEWFQLSDHLGGVPQAGGKVKFVGIQYWVSPNADADNSSGFSALPGGYRNRAGVFHSMRHFGFFWTTSETEPERAWIRHPNFYNGAFHRDNANKGCAYSVRCIKN